MHGGKQKGMILSCGGMSKDFKIIAYENILILKITLHSSIV
jgi:hypothetical protein